LIREGKVHQITNTIQTGRSEGMVTMDKAVEELIRTGKVSEHDALFG